MLSALHSNGGKEGGGASPHLPLPVASSRIREDSLEGVTLPRGEDTMPGAGVAMVRCLAVTTPLTASLATPTTVVDSSLVRCFNLPVPWGVVDGESLEDMIKQALLLGTAITEKEVAQETNRGRLLAHPT